ncbi:coiled-coil domain-containing protein [Herbidospora mongoliensis]|uniref:coiled-coil domain-containing protein n=1 Tax=Herbidospora mongoliensis TaxID=688067 RepID=UPI000A8CFA68|nr:hypothetical protein [Herbidospora mongoliensis]
MVALVAVLTPGTASAAPKPDADKLRKQLTSLDKKVNTLIAEYHSAREDLAKAKTASKAVQEKLTKAKAEFAAAQREMARLAGLSYQSVPGNGGILLPPGMGMSPLAQQLGNEQAATVRNYKQKEKAQAQALAEAKDLVVQIDEKSKDIEKRRKEAEELIGDIKDKLDDLIPIAPGKLTNGGWAPQLPTGADNITSRTRLMREEAKSAFKLHNSIGCFRVDTSGEHPLGRACDFMMTTGGVMATGPAQALGDSLAAWALKNRLKLGVKYVIWRQRINSGTGWRFMSNRGGNTANHYDHVHISMF